MPARALLVIIAVLAVAMMGGDLDLELGGVVTARTAWVQYQEHLVLHKRLQPQTVLDYRAALWDWFPWLEQHGRPWHRPTPQLLERYLDRHVRPGTRGRPGSPLAPNTASWYSSIILRFYVWAKQARLIRVNPLADVSPRRRADVDPRALDLDQVATLLASVANDERTLLAVGCAYFEMLRAGEIARQRIEWIDLRRKTMLVDGKGGHRDTIPIHYRFAPILAAHLAGRPRTGPLIENATRPGRHVLPCTVSRLIARAMRDAGIDESAHALRHTGATELLVALDLNVYPVSKMLRHRSLESTQTYVRNADRELADKLDRLPDPRRPSHQR